MTTQDAGQSPVTKRTLLISAAILALGIGTAYMIFASEPEAEREGASKKTAMLVRTLTVSNDTYQATVTVLGTVIPAREVMLKPRISGEIVSRNPSFTPGGFVIKGDSLLTVDKADYEVALKSALGDLAQTRAQLDIERGQQTIAEEDFKLLERDIKDADKSLVLRKPQLAIAEARMQSAAAMVEQAELDLSRTTVAAPFDGLVTERYADIGSQVAPGTELGKLVGTSEYWIETTIPLAYLQRLDIPKQAGDKGAQATIRNNSAWKDNVSRKGSVYALTGSLAPSTRLAKLLISVTDPLARSTDSTDLPSLTLGSFVEIDLKTKPIRGVIRLDRSAIRKGDTVWVMTNDKLDIRKVTITFTNQEFAFISDGLKDGDQVVISQLSRVVQDAPLRTTAENGEAPAK